MKLANVTVNSDSQHLKHWVELARSGEIKAFEWVVKHQQNSVRTYLAKRTDYSRDVDDLTQETFVLAWQKLAELEEVDAFNGWLFAIAKNLLRNHHRKLARLSPTEPDLVTQLLDQVSSEMDDREESAELTLLRQCLLKLDHQAQQTLRLYYHEGYSLQELRETTGVAHSTLTMRLSRYRTKLRDCINRG
ncbi:RNA polymerase sigma factor [Gilvimarinus polysaccharolyticus]|uniref:RNA polymerase sigma factor n=1 Tax=Gilvimarinus polysaccharolyticus TaxID=863921 RepID=UPI000673151E|nr:sigma-70 family RNA polymerase sigma factor [Gilvimarinus polysaccharolyticus]